jgi:preflagellin peptidase FlaK
MLVTLADALRLLVVPVFCWAAVRDIRTRRLPNRLWPPLYALGALTLALTVVGRWPLAGGDWLFAVRVAVSLFVVAPLGYGLWALGGFGGADAKAVIALALVFPTFPAYAVAGETLPLVSTPAGVFSLTVLTNALLVGLAYPLWLAITNLTAGERSRWLFFTRCVPTDSLTIRHGRLFESSDGHTRSGLDLDALRMYLRWRGTTIETVRSAPTAVRDPGRIGPTFDPTDGRVGCSTSPRTDTPTDTMTADGGALVCAGVDAGGVAPVDGGDSTERIGDHTGDHTGDEDGSYHEDDIHDDPWGAERFLAAIDHDAYGTDPQTLRAGLALVAEQDTVRVSPGLPFLVPLAAGLLVAVSYGDILFALLTVFGIA